MQRSDAPGGAAVEAAADVRAGAEPRRGGAARPRDWAPLLLVLLALALYLPGMSWGIPQATAADRTHAWGNDDQVPLAPLAEMYNTFVREEPNRNVAYPWFHYFLVAAAYAPYLGYLKLTGHMEDPAANYPFGLHRPEEVFRNLSWIGRSISILLALAVVLGAYYGGKYLWGGAAGWFAALFAMLMYPMVYYARTGNLDVPVLGWTTLALAGCALCLRQGVTTRRGVFLAIILALAFATKDQSAGSFIFLVPALILLHFRGLKEGVAPGRIFRPLLIALAVFAAAYAVASGALVDPSRFQEHTTKVFTVGAGTVSLYNRYPSTLAGYGAQALDLLRYLVDVMGWPLLVLALAGIAIAARRDRRTLLLLLSSVGFFAILLPVRFGRLHYLMPVALPLMLFAGYAVSIGLTRTRAVRALTLVLALGSAAYLLLQSIDLTHAMIKDSRYAAAEWLDQRARSGDRVLYFGASMTKPHLRADLASIHVDSRDDAHPLIQEHRPEFILVVPDDTNEERRRVEWRHGPHSIYSDYLPAELFNALADGSAGYRLLAKFQSPRLLPWLPRPFLSYPTVNPPVHIFVRDDRAGAAPRIAPWTTAPHYPRPRKSYEPVYTARQDIR